MGGWWDLCIFILVAVVTCYQIIYQLSKLIELHTKSTFYYINIKNIFKIFKIFYWIFLLLILLNLFLLPLLLSSSSFSFFFCSTSFPSNPPPSPAPFVSNLFTLPLEIVGQKKDLHQHLNFNSYATCCTMLEEHFNFSGTLWRKWVTGELTPHPYHCIWELSEFIDLTDY